MNELFWKPTTIAQVIPRTEVRRPSEMVLLIVFIYLLPVIGKK